MSEVVFDAVADRDVPQQFIDTFTPLVDEAKIHFNDDGIHTRAVDAANIAMNYVDLDPAAFEHYEAPGSVTQGANLNAIDDRLSLANGGDLVNLSLDMEVRKLSVDVRNIEQKVALIDPDSVRQEPDVPDHDLPNTVTLTGEDLNEVVTALDMVSDHLDIIGDPDAETVRFYAEGDTDESEVDFGREETLDPTKITEKAMSIFSMGYFKKLTKPIPKDAEVTIQFGEEFPMWMDWEACDGNLDVRQMLAPRIQSR